MQIEVVDCEPGYRQEVASHDVPALHRVLLGLERLALN